MFIVLDGTDGSGKDTQTDQLLAAAKRRGISAATIRYPAYEQTFSGSVIRAYQSGEFGDLSVCHPKLACYPYAVDRYEQQPKLQALLAANDLVIASRYVISNIAYQAVRVPEAERAAFRVWAETLDYEVMKNPREDAVIFLSLPVELSDQLIAKRNAGKAAVRDLYDENQAYRRDVLREYQLLCASHDHWHQVHCEAGTAIRSIEDIAQEIEQLVFERILATQAVAA